MGILRVLLAIAVIVSHCGVLPVIRPVSGSVAVEAFFIISGFYMSLILQEKYTLTNFRLFISNRLLRLFPVYWVVLLATCLFCLLIRTTSGEQNFPLFDQYLSVPFNGGTFFFLLFTNLFILGQDMVMFLGIHPATGELFFTSNFWQTSPPLYTFLFIPQAWSLGLELLFYLLAPWFVRQKSLWLGVCILLSLVLRSYLYQALSLKHDPWTYRFFPTELVFFLAGCLSYRLYRRIRIKKIPRTVNRLILVLLFLATCFCGYLPPCSSPLLPFSWNETVYFLGVGGCIPFLFNYSKNSKKDNRIGQLSYPMYISHFLVAAAINAMPFPLLKQSWVIVTATAIFAYLLDISIARPIEKYRQGRIRRSQAKLITLQISNL